MIADEAYERQYADLKDVKRISKEITSRPSLSDNERAVLDHLVRAYNIFSSMERVHPSEGDEFRLAIHQAQYLIARRVARRVDPDVWA